MTSYENTAAFDVSATGLLIYGASTANGGAGSKHVLWLSRSGETLSEVASASDYIEVALSPNGQRLAFLKGNPNSEMWIDDLARSVHTRLTFDPSTDKAMPVRSPDGKDLLFDMRPGRKSGPGISQISANWERPPGARDAVRQAR